MADVERKGEIFDVECLASRVGRAEHVFESSDYSFIIEIGWGRAVKLRKIKPGTKIIIKDSDSWIDNKSKHMSSRIEDESKRGWI